jgi:hypothetical protein
MLATISYVYRNINSFYIYKKNILQSPNDVALSKLLDSKKSKFRRNYFDTPTDPSTLEVKFVKIVGTQNNRETRLFSYAVSSDSS